MTIVFNFYIKLIKPRANNWVHRGPDTPTDNGNIFQGLWEADSALVAG